MTGERINPMVVKEVRQGLKSRGFVASLMLLQLLMVCCMLLYFLILSQPQGGSGGLVGADVFFWAILGLCLLVIIPAQACFSLSNEREQQTMELVQLTRLQSRNIVFGKNASHLLQAFLLFTAVLPFLVLRYFFGQLSVSGNLQVTFTMIGLGIFLTACGLWISSFPGKATRYTLMVCLFLATLVLGVFILEELSYSSLSITTRDTALFALFTIIYSRFFLWEAVARIAPAVENHTPRKRLISLVLLLAALGFLWRFPAEEFFILMLVLLTPMCVATLCEPAQPLAGLRARPGKLQTLGWIFRTPGFIPAATFVFTIFFALFCMSLLMIPRMPHHAYSHEPLVFAPVWLNVLLYPIPLMQWRNVPSEKRILFYLVVQLICLILGLMGMFLQETIWIAGDILIAAFPMWAFIDIIDNGGNYSQLLPNLTFSMLLIATILYRPVRHFPSFAPAISLPDPRDAENTPPA